MMWKLFNQFQITSLHLLKTLLKEDMLVFFSPLLLNKKPSSLFSRIFHTSMNCITTQKHSDYSLKMVVSVELKLKNSMMLYQVLLLSIHLLWNSLQFWLKTKDLFTSMVLLQDMLSFTNNSTKKRKLPLSPQIHYQLLKKLRYWLLSKLIQLMQVNNSNLNLPLMRPLREDFKCTLRPNSWTWVCHQDLPNSIKRWQDLLSDKMKSYKYVIDNLI